MYVRICYAAAAAAVCARRNCVEAAGKFVDWFLLGSFLTGEGVEVVFCGGVSNSSRDGCRSSCRSSSSGGRLTPSGRALRGAGVSVGASHWLLYTGSGSKRKT